MGKNISRPKQVTDWVARLEKLEQALAAESDSGLLVQPAWIEKNVLARLLRHKFTGPENISLPLSDSALTRGRPRLGWHEPTNADREAEGRRVPPEFLAFRGGC